MRKCHLTRILFFFPRKKLDIFNKTVIKELRFNIMKINLNFLPKS